MLEVCFQQIVLGKNSTMPDEKCQQVAAAEMGSRLKMEVSLFVALLLSSEECSVDLLEECFIGSPRMVGNCMQCWHWHLFSCVFVAHVFG